MSDLKAHRECPPTVDHAALEVLRETWRRREGIAVHDCNALNTKRENLLRRAASIIEELSQIDKDTQNS